MYLRPFVSGFRGNTIPPDRFFLVHSNAEPIRVHASNLVLGRRIFLRSRLSKPLHGFGQVLLFGSRAIEVNIAKPILRLWVTFRGLRKIIARSTQIVDALL